MHANDVIYSAGIREIRKFNSLHIFLEEALTESKRVNAPLQIRILVLFIEEFRSEDTDEKRGNSFQDILKELLQGSKVEIILPNYKSDQMRSFLNLRGKSFNNQDRVKQVENTVKHLTKFLSINPESAQNITIRFHEQFAGFPLLSYNDVWYQGHYLNSTFADETQYVKYTSEVGHDQLGHDLKLHYQKILNGSRSLSEFENYDTLLYRNAGEFINSTLSTLKPENAPIILSEGQSYSFYTHAAYKTVNDANQSRTHYISKNVIKIISTYEGNCYKAELYTKTKMDDRDIVIKHTGIITFDKSNQDIFMYFHEENGYTPVVISGRLPNLSVNTKMELLILHHTFVSRQRKNNNTNIGILDLTSRKATCEPELLDLKLNFSKQIVEEKAIVDEITLFLMRKNKVSIKTPKFLHNHTPMEIYSKEQIQNFFRARFKALENHIDEYLLYYPKSNLTPSTIAEYGRANLKIMPNGIIELNLISVGDRGNEYDEHYYGDMNFQQTSSSSPIVSIKFIRSAVSDAGLPTCYRELFLFLFWDCEDGNKNFEITRGILLGDRDKKMAENQEWDRSIIESDQCVLVQKELFEKRNDQLQIIRSALSKENNIKLTGNETVNLHGNGNHITIQYNNKFHKLDHAIFHKLDHAILNLKAGTGDDDHSQMPPPSIH
jgi:hypothetical protein